MYDADPAASSVPKEPEREVRFQELRNLDTRLPLRVENFIEEFQKGLHLSSEISFQVKESGRGRKAMCPEVRYAGGLAVGGKCFRILFQFENPSLFVIMRGQMGEIDLEDQRDIFRKIETLARFSSWLDLGEEKYEPPRARDESVPPARKPDTFIFTSRMIGSASMVIPAAPPRKEVHNNVPSAPRKERKKRRPGPNNMELACLTALRYGEKAFSVGAFVETLCNTLPAIFTAYSQAVTTVWNAEKKGYFTSAEKWGTKILTSSGRAVGKRVAAISPISPKKT